MTYEDLVKDKIIEPYEVTHEEIAAKMQDARHDIEVSESEAKDIIAFSKRFLDEILDLLPEQIVKMSKES